GQPRVSRLRLLRVEALPPLEAGRAPSPGGVATEVPAGAVERVAAQPPPPPPTTRSDACRTSRSQSSSNSMPAARAASGKSESEVSPGTVLTSRTQGVPAASTI